MTLSLSTTDEQTGFVTTNVYEQQTWQVSGMLRSSEVRKPSCGSPLMSQTNRTQAKAISQSNGATTWFPYVAGSTATTADLTCAALTTVVTSGPNGAADISYDNWGNLLGNDVVTSGDTQTYTTTTVNSYKTADVQNWLVGLLDTATVTKAQSNDNNVITRSVAHDYEAITGAVKTQTVQPNDTTNLLKLVTTFGRANNPFGLIDTKTVSWTDPFSSTSQSAKEVTSYDDNGRFAISITNALSQTQTRTYFEGTGAPKSATDPNGLTVNWETDGFGRATSEQHLADGNTVQTARKQCGGAALCAPGSAMVTVIERFNGGVRTAVPQMTFADSVGHALRTVTYSTDGTRGTMPVIVDQHYDGRGRLSQQDQPRFDADPAILAKYMEYDDLNRVTLTRVLDDAGANSDTTSEYAQWVTTLTNARNYKRVETRDALGRLTQVLDAKNGTTGFKYDAFGNLTKTTDPGGNIIAVSYDALGRKIGLNDPDLGNITYLVDARGLVRRQLSPNHVALGGDRATPPASPTADKAVRMEYDLLGRMTARYEPDLESHWVFDQQPGGSGCQTTKSCGQLVEAYTGTAANKDYRRTHAYDIKGRPSMVWQHLFDADYTSTPDYDSWSRPISVTYQRGTDAKKIFDQRYDNLGALVRVERQGAKLWEASAWDAAGHVLTAKLGNGLTQSQSYYATTNRFKNSTLATATGTPRLTEGYSYDKLGNVYTRTWAWNTNPVTETFSYDALNRIEWSEVSGQTRQNFSYDATGNITFKTGVGTYTYQTGAGVARPHAVQSILSAASVKTSFTYDNNGNRTGSDNRTESWTSFDMPMALTKTIAGTIYANQFRYGAEHQRVRQIKLINGVESSTVVYAGAQEVETTNGVATVKTYWPMGLGVEIDKGGVTNLYWSHKDNLGSPIGLTNATGDFSEKLAYDVWGKRRTLDGAPDTSGTPTPDSIDGVVDNKGYTGHEMLDQIDLVHMNGRVFDPLVGKFLSADPLIQEPTNGQNYNRYAYVFNNPTNLTDPTGFCADGTNKRACKGMTTSSQNFGDTNTIATLKWALEDAANVIVTRISRTLNGTQKNDGKQGGSQPPQENNLVSANSSGSGPTCTAGSSADTCATHTNNIVQDGMPVVVVKPDGYVKAKQSTFGVTPADREVGTMLGIAASGLPFERPFVWGYRAVQSYRAERAADALSRFSGNAKPWTTGATPNSAYTHIDPKTGKAVQNAIYDAEGNVIGHVDFKNHGPGAPSGHGHTFPEPGNPASGHGAGKPHIPNNELPRGWDSIPSGVAPHTPIGF